MRKQKFDCFFFFSSHVAVRYSADRLKSRQSLKENGNSTTIQHTPLTAIEQIRETPRTGKYARVVVNGARAFFSLDVYNSALSARCNIWSCCIYCSTTAFNNQLGVESHFAVHQPYRSCPDTVETITETGFDYYTPMFLSLGCSRAPYKCSPLM